jgi:hypothetical protein
MFSPDAEQALRRTLDATQKSTLNQNSIMATTIMGKFTMCVVASEPSRQSNTH